MYFKKKTTSVDLNWNSNIDIKCSLFSQDRLIFSSSESEITRAGGYRTCGRTDSAEICKLDVTVTALPSQTCLQHVGPVIILKSFPVPEYSTALHLNLTEVR